MKISELPADVKELALFRQLECKDLKYSKTKDTLGSAFDWGSTIEGYDYWDEWDDKDPKNYNEIISIIETKIATMSSRGFESYYLPIGILKDLIREIKEIK